MTVSIPAHEILINSPVRESPVMLRWQMRSSVFFSLKICFLFVSGAFVWTDWSGVMEKAPFFGGKK